MTWKCIYPPHDGAVSDGRNHQWNQVLRRERNQRQVAPEFKRRCRESNLTTPQWPNSIKPHQKPIKQRSS